MKKARLASLIVLGLFTVSWTADRISPFLPDWAVRLNGVIMLAACAALVFTTVRLNVKSS